MRSVRTSRTTIASNASGEDMISIGASRELSSARYGSNPLTCCPPTSRTSSRHTELPIHAGHDCPMPSWRPETATDPDGRDEWRYRTLGEVDASMATRLVDRFAPRWLRRAGLPIRRLPDVPDTIELKAAASWDPPDGSRVLRLRSWYTGETTWLYDWAGDFETAAEWIDGAADIFGDWIEDERAIGGGPTPWEE